MDGCGKMKLKILGTISFKREKHPGQKNVIFNKKNANLADAYHNLA